MNMKRITLASLLLTAGQAHAQENTYSTWHSEVELGFVTTSGNTNTETINGKSKTLNERTHWRNQMTMEALHAQNSAATTAEKYDASTKSKYKIDDRQYVFGLLKYDNDRFSGFDYRSSEAIGYGQRVIADMGMTFDIEAGPGARQSKPSNSDINSEGLSWLNGDFIWNIDKKSIFTEELGTEIATSAAITSSATGLKTQINGSLAMKLTYFIQYTSKVPEGVEKGERKSTVTLVYSF